MPIQLLSRADTDFFRVKYRRRTQWHKTLVKAILLFSDQQIVTGIAIMVAVYARLDTTSVYHFRIAMYLAWMSSNTHLTTLVVLRKYLMKSKVLRIWRLSGMVALYIMLLVAFIPGALWNWEEVTKGQSAPISDPARSGLLFFNPNLPARCIFETPPFDVADAAVRARIFDTGATLGWKWSIALVSALYFVKAGLLFKGITHFIWMLFKALPCYVLEKALQRSAAAAHLHTLVRHQTGGSLLSKPAHLKRWARFKYRALVSSYLLLVAFMDNIETFIANLLLLSWGTIWGTMEILNSSFIFDQSDNQENYWGFGQILPVMMLLLPIASIINSVFGGDKAHEKRSRDHMHRAHMMEEAEGSVSSASTSTTTLNTPGTSRSSSRSTTRSRLDRALPPLPALDEQDFKQPPRYQATIRYPGQTYSGFDEKIPLHDDFDDLLASPVSETASPDTALREDPFNAQGLAPTTHPNFPYGCRSPLLRTDSNFEKYHADQRQYSSSKEALPLPSQFIFGRRTASSRLDQPLSEVFRTASIIKPRWRDPTDAAKAEAARCVVLQKYLYKTKWCQSVFVIHTLAQVGAIATLTIFAIFQKQNALASWYSIVAVVLWWMGSLALWWLLGLVVHNKVYR